MKSQENQKDIFVLEKKYTKQIDDLRSELKKLKNEKEDLENKYSSLKNITVKSTETEREISNILTEKYMEEILKAYKRSIGLRLLKEEMKNKEIEYENEYKNIMNQIDSLIKDIKSAY